MYTNPYGDIGDCILQWSIYTDIVVSFKNEAIGIYGISGIWGAYLLFANPYIHGYSMEKKICGLVGFLFYLYM